MNGYLLDTNLLIALLWPSHVRHDLDQRIESLTEPRSAERKALEIVG